MMKGYKFKVNSEGYPNSDAVMRRGVLLPIHHGMKNSMFERLHETIEEFLKNR